MSSFSRKTELNHLCNIRRKALNCTPTLSNANVAVASRYAPRSEHRGSTFATLSIFQPESSGLTARLRRQYCIGCDTTASRKTRNVPEKRYQLLPSQNNTLRELNMPKSNKYFPFSTLTPSLLALSIYLSAFLKNLFQRIFPLNHPLSLSNDNQTITGRPTT